MKEAPRGGPIRIADVDAVRKVLGRISQDYSQPSDAAAARAIGHIDDFLTNLRQPDLLSGAAPSANRILSEARANWAAAARATEAENATGNAQIQAAVTGSGRNVGNATRQKFKTALMDDGRRLGGYTPLRNCTTRESRFWNASRQYSSGGFENGWWRRRNRHHDSRTGSYGHDRRTSRPSLLGDSRDWLCSKETRKRVRLTKCYETWRNAPATVAALSGHAR
jgi:hypothetical protein